MSKETKHTPGPWNPAAVRELVKAAGDALRASCPYKTGQDCARECGDNWGWHAKLRAALAAIPHD